MNKSLRRAVIAGNWKMNMTPAETAELIDQIKPLVAGAGCSVVVCTPYVDLGMALEAAKGSNIEIGAQNCHWAEKGAFTGEVLGENAGGHAGSLCDRRPQRAAHRILATAT